METINYNTGTYPFKELIKKAINSKNLAFIHKNQDFVHYDKFERKNDQSTNYHKNFYEFARTKEFISVYYNFIKKVIKPTFKTKELVFQKIPTFRLHFPGNLAVGEFHRDRNYRDENWAKEVKEFNFFLPCTEAYDTNTIWLESEEGKEDFFPMNTEYGQVVKWDGSNLLHGNKTNEESTTRISFDFRAMPIERYKSSSKGSINMDTKFALGAYYDKI